MATISVQTKKFADLETLRTVGGTETMLIHDGDGVKTVTVENLQAALKASINALWGIMPDGAGSHNAIYRGKRLGTSVTAAQYAAIKAGTFSDLYIGDYWTVNGVNYRIAGFDYYYNTGDKPCISHHAVLVPDTTLYEAQMNTTNTAEGGYVGSAMYKTNLARAKTTIKAAFSGHVLSHRVNLTNAIKENYASGGAWCDSEVELMNQYMLHGTAIYGLQSPVGTTMPYSYTVETSQLPLFQHEHSRICCGQQYWLRDVTSFNSFAVVYSGGDAGFNKTSEPFGVRPAFAIY